MQDGQGARLFCPKVRDPFAEAVPMPRAEHGATRKALGYRVVLDTIILRPRRARRNCRFGLLWRKPGCPVDQPGALARSADCSLGNVSPAVDAPSPALVVGVVGTNLPVQGMDDPLLLFQVIDNVSLQCLLIFHHHCLPALVLPSFPGRAWWKCRDVH